jgi:two-component system NtrC family response regulator
LAPLLLKAEPFFLEFSFENYTSLAFGCPGAGVRGEAIVAFSLRSGTRMRNGIDAKQQPKQVPSTSVEINRNGSPKNKLLVVAREQSFFSAIRWALAPEYDLLAATNEHDGCTAFQTHRPPVVMVEVALNPADRGDVGGLRLLEQIVAQEPETRVIVVTDNDDYAIRAVRLGAFDCYPKPIPLDVIKIMIERSFHIHRMRQRIRRDYASAESTAHGLVGTSQAIHDVISFIEQVAGSDISLLICGESGSGKDLAAQAIHRQSRRKNYPFVAVNCAAIPENLLESELFGHERGAFTGAYNLKRGKFELAHKGTLFLDEIGDLAPSLQVKLLRFLQDRRIEHVGGTQTIELDVRIIAATNRDLKRDMENGLFREDLYYRLKVVPLEIPPLRERPEDIVPLAQHFLEKYCREHRRPLITLSTEAELALLNYGWPGNVRELENLINRTVVLSSRRVLRAQDLGFVAGPKNEDVNLKFAKKAMEEDFVKKALSRNKGIVSRAAKDLGVSRVNLYELIQRYAIELQSFKTDAAEKPQTRARGGILS